MANPIKLIIGLGNPGREYEHTRHNVGRWFIDRLLAGAGGALSKEVKFKALTARTHWHGHDFFVLFPLTFMNLSGQAVASFAHYFQISAENLLVVHDELDLPLGTVRLKKGGGPGGHKGVHDIIERLGSREFLRLRIGIGHPGRAELVTPHVLNRPTLDEKIEIDRSIDRALNVMPDVLAGHLEKAMQTLHGG